MSDLVFAIEENESFAVHGRQSVAQIVKLFAGFAAQEEMTNVWV